MPIPGEWGLEYQPLKPMKASASSPQPIQANPLTLFHPTRYHEYASRRWDQAGQRQGAAEARQEEERKEIVANDFSSEQWALYHSLDYI